MPFHGQLRQLRAWSDRPGRRDPRAKKGGVYEMDRQKSVQKQKDMCRQNALATWRNRKTRTRREWRRRARLHAQAASEAQSPHMMQRGGEKKKRREECGGNLARPSVASSEQKQRRQERNKQIWQELHTTWLKKDSMEDPSVQPAMEKVTESSMTPADSDMIQRSNENQY